MYHAGVIFDMVEEKMQDFPKKTRLGNLGDYQVKVGHRCRCSFCTCLQENTTLTCEMSTGNKKKKRSLFFPQKGAFRRQCMSHIVAGLLANPTKNICSWKQLFDCESMCGRFMQVYRNKFAMKFVTKEELLLFLMVELYES